MVRDVAFYRRKASEKHPLHLKIGDLFDELFDEHDLVKQGYSLIRDEACGGIQHIPLFIGSEQSRRTKYCNVDLLVTFGDKIRTIVEIEESNVKPTQVCGKFLTAAISRYYIHGSEGNDVVGMGENVTFIQFVDTSGLKQGKTAKVEQWSNIERSIVEFIPLRNSGVTRYKLFNVNASDLSLKDVKDALKTEIYQFL